MGEVGVIDLKETILVFDSEEMVCQPVFTHLLSILIIASIIIYSLLVKIEASSMRL